MHQPTESRKDAMPESFLQRRADAWGVRAASPRDYVEHQERGRPIDTHTRLVDYTHCYHQGSVCKRALFTRQTTQVSY